MLSYLIEHNRYCNLLGIAVVILIGVIFSRRRKDINPRLIINALILEGVLAFFMLSGTGQSILSVVAGMVKRLYEFADVGSAFLFGNLVNPVDTPWGFIFAVKVLPIIVFFGALMSLLFHFGVIQVIVKGMSFVVRPLLGTSGPETLCAVANSFLGQTEAPLLIRHYLMRMTKPQIFVVMVSGMATISGAILAVFASMGVPAAHLLTSSIIAIPGSIMIAKLLYPDSPVTEQFDSSQDVEPDPVGGSGSMFSAIARGTTDGMYLALNVGAMLIAFLALLAMINSGMESVSTFFGLPPINLNWIFSYLFAPFGYLLGFTGEEALAAGRLLGIKVTVNELVAYGAMVKMGLSERAVALMTYALCGFSNFSCIGIQIGGIGALVPERREWLCELGLLAVMAGALSNLLGAFIVGLML